MSHGVTLKELAAAANVSIATVHRALENKEGCSKELREKILRIAEEEGYTKNYYASSLRTHTLNISLVFPVSKLTGRFYLDKVLMGIRAYYKEIEGLNINYTEHLYSIAPGEPDSDGTLEALDQILESEEKCDGIILFALNATAELDKRIYQLISRKIPVVTLESNPFAMPLSGLVHPDETMAGRMAGELMAKELGSSAKGTVLVLEQPLDKGDINAKSFERELTKRLGSKVEVIHQALELLDVGLESEIDALLESRDDIIGIYITCARHTYSYLLTQASQRKNIKVIGSEIFRESHDALHDGRLDAVIDKRPNKMGYKALEMLFSRLLRKEESAVDISIPPRLVLSANSDIYYI